MNSNFSKKDEIKLPFEREDFDVGVWSYDHRAGLFISIIIYLLIAIGFLVTRISVMTTKQTNTIIVDLEQLEELEQLKQELERENKEIEKLVEQASEVQNEQSNEASEEEASSEEVFEEEPLSDDFQEMLEEFERTQREMAANKELMEQDAQAAKLPEPSRAKKTDEAPKPRRDRRAKGNVTVSYAIVNPIRHAVDLRVPSYMCENGGKVVINVQVNRNGYVTDARVWRSSGDFCIEEAALSAALSSRFDFNAKAPSSQKGRITYLFVSQN